MFLPLPPTRLFHENCVTKLGIGPPSMRNRLSFMDIFSSSEIQSQDGQAMCAKI